MYKRSAIPKTYFESDRFFSNNYLDWLYSCSTLEIIMEFTCLYCNCPALFYLRCNNECNIVVQQGIRAIIYLLCYIYILCPRCQRNTHYTILNFLNNAPYTFIGSENEADEHEIAPMDVDDDNGVLCWL